MSTKVIDSLNNKLTAIEIWQWNISRQEWLKACKVLLTLLKLFSALKKGNSLIFQGFFVLFFLFAFFLFRFLIAYVRFTCLIHAKGSSRRNVTDKTHEIFIGSLICNWTSVAYIAIIKRTDMLQVTIYYELNSNL